MAVCSRVCQMAHSDDCTACVEHGAQLLRRVCHLFGGWNLFVAGSCVTANETTVAAEEPDNANNRYTQTPATKCVCARVNQAGVKVDDIWTLCHVVYEIRFIQALPVHDMDGTRTKWSAAVAVGLLSGVGPYTSTMPGPARTVVHYATQVVATLRQKRDRVRGECASYLNKIDSALVPIGSTSCILPLYKVSAVLLVGAALSIVLAGGEVPEVLRGEP
jgi:hypothetical protein